MEKLNGSTTNHEKRVLLEGGKWLIYSIYVGQVDFKSSNKHGDSSTSIRGMGVMSVRFD